MSEALWLLAGTVVGAAAALGGVVLGARLVWRASGHDGRMVLPPPERDIPEETTG